MNFNQFLNIANTLHDGLILERRGAELTSFKAVSKNDVTTSIPKEYIKEVYVLKTKYANPVTKTSKMNLEKDEKLLKKLVKTPICELVNTIEAATFFRNKLLQSKKTNPYGYCVDAHEAKDYVKSIMLLSAECNCGAVVTLKDKNDKEKNPNDVQSVFGGNDSSTYTLLACAVERGGRTLDAYTINNVLPNLYTKFGFEEYGRVKFNPDYAPDDMPNDVRERGRASADELAKGGRNDGLKRPDVTLMARKPSRKSTVREFRKNYKSNKTTDLGLKATGIKRNYDKEDDFEKWEDVEKKRKQDL